jgi:hypothetical protein
VWSTLSKLWHLMNVQSLEDVSRYLFEMLYIVNMYLYNILKYCFLLHCYDLFKNPGELNSYSFLSLWLFILTTAYYPMLNHFLCEFCMKNHYYEAQILQKWSRTRTGYFLGTRTLGVLLPAYPRRTQNFSKKKKKDFLSFFLLDMSQK